MQATDRDRLTPATEALVGNRAGWGGAGQSRAGWGGAEHGRAGRGGAGRGRAWQGRAGQGDLTATNLG